MQFLATIRIVFGIDSLTNCKSLIMIGRSAEAIGVESTWKQRMTRLTLNFVSDKTTRSIESMRDLNRYGFSSVINRRNALRIELSVSGNKGTVLLFRCWRPA